jgi:uncharacterized membrane-anchored protein YjiN (DUF445 family)
VGLDAVAGRVAAKKLMAGLARLVQELAEDPQHELRQRLDASMAGLVGRLQQDDELRQRAQALLHDVLQHPSVGAYLQQLWGQLMGWLQADLQRDDSTLRRHVGGLALALGQRLQADAAMQQWINDQLMAAAPPVVARYREDIRRYIASRVEAWDTAEMTRELERSIGRDLQFVRINGTLVGGLIGLAIFSVTEWLRRF